MEKREIVTKLLDMELQLDGFMDAMEGLGVNLNETVLSSVSHLGLVIDIYGITDGKDRDPVYDEFDRWKKEKYAVGVFLDKLERYSLSLKSSSSSGGLAPSDE